jgi:hypothetical protein
MLLDQTSHGILRLGSVRIDDKAAFTEKQMGDAAISAAVQLAVINRVPYCCRDHAVQY